MAKQNQVKIVDTSKLPKGFPTHRHNSLFWEALGRTIATYGFLEEILGKAIFVFSGQGQYSEETYNKWITTLERALSSPLGGLIESYEKVAKEYRGFEYGNMNRLIFDLKNAAKYRNVLCHGSWYPPNDKGKSIPLFVTRENSIWDTPIDISDLENIQQHVSELACSVMNSVACSGLNFPSLDLTQERW